MSTFSPGISYPVTGTKKMLGREAQTLCWHQGLFISAWRADPWTTDLDSITKLFVCLSFSCLSVSFIWSCISRLASLNYRLNYIIAWSEIHPLCLTCPKLALSFCSRLLVFLLKELYWHWTVWRARSQAVSEHLLPFWPFPFLRGSLCSPQEGRRWITELSGVGRNQSCASQSLPTNLWDLADYLELTFTDLLGWGFSDVAPGCGGIAREKAKWLRLLCCQAHWAERLPSVLVLAPSALYLQQLQLVSSKNERTESE